MFKFPQRNRTSANLPLIALSGAIIGSAAALLFTPKKGSDLRNGIKDAANKLRPHNNSKNEPVMQSDMDHKATMHANYAGQPKDEYVSKAAAMVNHLKESKQQNNGHPEIL